MTTAERWRGGAVLLALLSLLLLLPPPAAAQEAGSIRGRIVVANTLRPLVGAQISIPDAGLGGLTNANGEFLIVNVPVGTHRVRAQMIGFSPLEREVTVGDAGVQNVIFELAENAIALDEVVVTGTAGQARRREVGNSISQINLAEVQQPSASTDQLLQGRVAGVTAMQSSGQVGSGAQIRLRGNVSVAMSNTPLIYVDGVRIRSEGYPITTGNDYRAGRGRSDTNNPLNDINPDDIARIEVIKGAAATTLYGTEAAAGVIQIFTKRGQSGAPEWVARVEQGVAQMRPFGPDDAPYLFIDPWLRSARQQSYSLSVSGGTNAVQYFVSGSFDDNQGVLPNDWQEKMVARGNFTFSPMDDLQFQWNTSYTNDNYQNTPAGNNSQGLTLNAFRRDKNYFGDDSYEAISSVLDFGIYTYVDHLVTGLTANYTPLENFANRLTVGFDQSHYEGRQLRPYGFRAFPQGALTNKRWSNTNLTLEYVGTYDLSLGQDLRASLSVGGQSVTVEETEVEGWSTDFPGPGEPTLNSGAQTQSFEERQRVINAGLFVQSLFGFKDRYFLTLGLRVDGNSAFGEDFGLQPYPKASFSYVVSDEPFWPQSLGTVKLRAAYGHAGRAPGAFDAVRTWDPIGWAGAPAFVPLNVGNADLGPERTAELEMGADAAFLDGRLTADLTYYRQKTTDALLEVRQVPSLGFLRSQLENVGTLQNQGLELAMSAALVQRPALEWSLGLNVSTNQSKVLDLGGAPEFSLGSFGWVVEGQPVPVIRARKIMNPDEKAPAQVEEEYYYGPNSPTLIIGPSTHLRLPGNVQLTARGEYQGGHYVSDSPSNAALSRSVEWPTCFDAYPLIEAGQQDQLTAKQRMECVASNVRGDWFIYPADFFKIREVALTVPVGFAVPGAGSASLVLSAQNFWTWKNKDFPLFDPEVMGNQGSLSAVRSISEHIPPPAVYTAALRLRF